MISQIALNMAISLLPNSATKLIFQLLRLCELLWPPELVVYAILLFNSIGFAKVFLISLMFAVTILLPPSFLSQKTKIILIKETRLKINLELEEIKIYVENSTNKSFKLQHENSFLRDKVKELEKSRKALIEELGGSADNINLEFEIWQQITDVIDILVNDRIRLLALLNIAVSSSGAVGSPIDANQLLQDFSQLKQEKSQLEQAYESKQKELISVTTKADKANKENESLRKKDCILEQKIQHLSSDNFKSKEEVISLRRKIKDLEKDIKLRYLDIKNLEKEIAKTQKEQDSFIHKSKEEAISLRRKIKDLEKDIKLRRLDIKNLKKEIEKTQEEQDSSIHKSKEIYRLTCLEEEWEKEQERYNSCLAEKATRIAELKTLLKQSEHQIHVLIEESQRNPDGCEVILEDVNCTREDFSLSGKCWAELRQLRRRVSRTVEREVLLELQASYIEEVLEPR